MTERMEFFGYSEIKGNNEMILNQTIMKYNEAIDDEEQLPLKSYNERYGSIIKPLALRPSATMSPDSVIKPFHNYSVGTLSTAYSGSTSSDDTPDEDDDKTLLIKNYNSMKDAEEEIDLGQFLHSKLLLSFCIWLISYMIMAFLGGSVAFYHFPRVYPESENPVPLPDFGYDLIPYYCPMLSQSENSNPQSVILLFFYIVILISACFKPKPQGRLVIQQLLHLNSILFLMRTTTVGLTGFPQPNPRCQSIQSIEISYWEAVQFVFRAVLPHACGDLVFSGHISCIFNCMVIFHKHRLFSGIVPYIVAWILSLTSIYTVISCRSHYSVDVVLAFYFVYFTQDWYYSRCNNQIPDGGSKAIVRFIAWLEDRMSGKELPREKVDNYLKIDPYSSSDSDNIYDYYPYHCDLR